MKYFTFLLLVFFTSQVSSQRYRKIHRQAIVVDTHNDLLGATIMEGMHLEDDLTGKVHSDFRRFKAGGVDVQIFAVFCDSTFGKDTAFKFANIEIDSLYAIAKRNPDKLELVKTPWEMIQVVNRKKLAGIIGVEGGHMIEDNMLYLDSLFNRGARYLTLTWNNSTSWATSSLDESNERVIKKGLTDFGKTIVKRMNELGMMIDVSHVGQQTLADVLHTSTKPVIASHSCAFAINPHHRNLKDEQIRAIAKNGGVLQVNFYTGFLDSHYVKMKRQFDAAHKTEIDSLEKLNWSGPANGLYLKNKYPDEFKKILPSIAVLLDHIDYIKNLVGIDYVGLGSDFDGVPYTPIDLEDVSKFPNITKGLRQRGYSKSAIKKVLGGNFIRVFKENMK